MTAIPPARVSLDPAPKLGGNLDANKKNISNVEQLSFRTLYDDSLVGWWPFVAGSAADSSRYGNNGAFVGGANANNKMHFKELSDARHERELQERQRHEDSAALSGALTNMAVQCAKSQSERQAEKRG